MTQRTLPGDPSVAITLRKSRASRRFSLRVSRLDGRVTLSMPVRAAEAEAMAFAVGQADWIRRALARATPILTVGVGSVFPFEGRMLTVAAAQVRVPRVEGDVILVPAGDGRAAGRVAAFLKLAARQRLQGACERYAGQVVRPFRKITLRDTRSRWGSCAADGSLMFSWRLIMAPAEVLDYVAAHEVAHLVEMNHAPEFWAVVPGLMPDYARHRRWIRTHGAGLHGYSFSD